MHDNVGMLRVLHAVQYKPLASVRVPKHQVSPTDGNKQQEGGGNMPPRRHPSGSPTPARASVLHYCNITSLLLFWYGSFSLPDMIIGSETWTLSLGKLIFFLPCTKFDFTTPAHTAGVHRTLRYRQPATPDRAPERNSGVGGTRGSTMIFP
jgi:hypothetical protein